MRMIALTLVTLLLAATSIAGEPAGHYESHVIFDPSLIPPAFLHHPMRCPDSPYPGILAAIRGEADPAAGCSRLLPPIVSGYAYHPFPGMICDPWLSGTAWCRMR